MVRIGSILKEIRQFQEGKIFLWGVVCLCAVILYVLFGIHQPFTNDEGAYLYDARTILEGKLPAGDVLTKAPVPILLFAAGELFTGKSLFAARIVNSFASIVTVIPLFLLLHLLASKKAAYVGATLWLFGSGTIIFYTIGHTQPIASLFAVTCLYLFIAAFYSPHPNPLPARGEGNIWGANGTTKFFLAGICFALAYMSRKTAIAVTAPLILSLIVLGGARIAWRKVSIVFLLGAFAVIIPWLASMYALYGTSGIWHALGAGYGDILVHSKSIMPWAGSADRMSSEAIRLGVIYIFLLTIVVVVLVRDIVRKTTKSALVIFASWIATLAVLYFLWPTHLVEYLADFIPAIVIAGAIAIAGIFVRFDLAPLRPAPPVGGWRGLRGAGPIASYFFALIFIVGSIISLHSVYVRPWTGMFTRDAIVESATWLKHTVPVREEIFTAAVIIPYLSGHHVSFNLSHPQWYRYSFISEKDKDTFLPAYGELSKALHTWALRDQLTDYAYPGISFSGFQEMHTVTNNTGYRQNPLRVYSKYEH